MTSLGSYVIRFQSWDYDIWPLATEALRVCPYKHDLSVGELCDLTRQTAEGRYIKVDIQARVEGSNLGWLIHTILNRVHRETYWPDRIAKMKEPDLCRMTPYIEFIIEDGCCSVASSLHGRWISHAELAPLPLDGCNSDHCRCDYRCHSHRRALQAHPEWFDRGHV